MWSFEVKAARYLEIEVEAEGGEIEVLLLDPDDTTVARSDNVHLPGFGVTERVRALTDKRATYWTLAVQLQEFSQRTKYQVRWLANRPIGDRDRARLEVDRYLLSTSLLHDQGNSVAAKAKLQQAPIMAGKGLPAPDLAQALFDIGSLQFSLLRRDGPLDQDSVDLFKRVLDYSERHLRLCSKNDTC